MIQLIALISIIIIFPFASFVCNTISHILLWQNKEYRFDRMYAYIKYADPQAFRSVYYYTFILFLIIGNISFLIYPTPFHYILTALVFIIYLTSTLRCLENTLTGKFKRPKISIRNILILFSVLFLYTSILATISFMILGGYDIPFNEPEHTSIATLEKFISFSQTPSAQNIILLPIGIIITIQIAAMVLDALQPIFVIFGVSLTQPLSTIVRKNIISKARKKIKNFKNLKIIGITGSFGKTTTKEFLVSILSKFYNTAVTPKNINTTIGIAQTILDRVDSKTEIFIVEIGTYKKGEILEATRLVPLDISILTNIGPSHLDLFGSIKNIIEAKSEIIQGTKPGGICILNADDKEISNLKPRKEIQTLYFSSEGMIQEDTIEFRDIQFDDPQVSFIMKSAEKNISFTTKLLSPHLFPNLAASLTCAHALECNLLEVKNFLKSQIFKSGHFKILDLDSGIILLDDSYNSNPKGFKGALMKLKSYKGKKKILLSNGLVETRMNIKSIYTDLSLHIKDSTDLVITSDPMLLKQLFEKEINCIAFKDNNELIKILKNNLNSKTVILVEGRMHPDILTYLKNFKFDEN